jgi:hypothetical protein
MAMANIRVAARALLALAFLACMGARATPPEAGPLVQQFSLTLEPGERAEAFGPALYYQISGSSATWGFPPIAAGTQDPILESREVDILYPFLNYDQFGSEYKLRIFLLTSFTGGDDQDQNQRRRFTIFPFFFRQRSTIPEQNYTALFPIYGTIKERMFRDEIRFVLFPIYGQSRKRDVVTDNYLYPIFHLRRGDQLSGWQLWPFAGYEQKAFFTRTNNFNEIVESPGHEKFFVLWPFYFHDRTGLGTTNPVVDRVILPFYASTRSPARDSTSYFWPFYMHTEDRQHGYQEWDAPWPLIVSARGPGKHGDRIWPFYSHMKGPVDESQFILWPGFLRYKAYAPPFARDRWRILFFAYSDVTELDLARHTEYRRRDCWPLFSARRDHQGNERLQVFALLEPFLPNNKSVERDWSPLWSVWRQEYNRSSGARSQSLLWNLYRRETTLNSKKTTALFGLFRYQSGPEGRRLHLFYIPVIKPPATPAAPTTS